MTWVHKAPEPPSDRPPDYILVMFGLFAAALGLALWLTHR